MSCEGYCKKWKIVFILATLFIFLYLEYLLYIHELIVSKDKVDRVGKIDIWS